MNSTCKIAGVEFMLIEYLSDVPKHRSVFRAVALKWWIMTKNGSQVCPENYK